ncbi:MAG: histidine--tRNA ligase [Rhodospirillaceae bacterium]|jgi:histidyl-tRNA synthetase|nr:histidine--tRNA ligase [Rhodospirillaceae bacterium]MBT5243998.1 histidine--tRNA ligase [Rhodospirillaceae bacterium]MBT5560818.1 histidine--tRNA ligase [Rhodospirillaceae bacterium]MBT6240556.1 histidine--tRNA ligase [Rhodospirillaceae bacterium]MBT7138374.1 histidine--tRNA ligase [Rhodospirillaceae bacterium]
MSTLQPVRGTHDLLAEDSLRHRKVIDTVRDISGRYGFDEIETPIFERTEVFARTLGDTSDIVTKEMYTFEDKGGDSLTLRPENTAGVARAFISGGLAQSLPLKFTYQGSMFRYERPQKGRLRQFHQTGAEILGVEGPLADIEIIALGSHYLEALGVRDKTLLELNSLGDTESRTAYRDMLVDYFRSHFDELSEDSRDRLERNPLRILDSKDQGDRAIIENAPLISDSFNDYSRDFFETVKQGLDVARVEYTLNPRLVRGLDYYCHTAFEFTTTELGAQGALVAGGRYDGLIKQMGGPPTPGVGWAAGVERLAMMIDDPEGRARPIAMVPLGAEAEIKALGLTQRLRQGGFSIELGYSGNMKKRMKRANSVGAAACVILGEDELAKDVATVRNMETGDQVEVPLASLEDHLAGYR